MAFDARKSRENELHSEAIVRRLSEKSCQVFCFGFR